MHTVHHYRGPIPAIVVQALTPSTECPACSCQTFSRSKPCPACGVVVPTHRSDQATTSMFKQKRKKMKRLNPYVPITNGLTGETREVGDLEEYEGLLNELVVEVEGEETGSMLMEEHGDCVPWDL